jgi:hypothetical protein
MCSRCQQLSVTCYGYGPKPLWMDGGAREEEMHEKIRKAVKLITDSQRRARALRGLKKIGEQGQGLKEQGEPEPEAQVANVPGSSSRDLCQTLPIMGARLQLAHACPVEPPWTSDLELQSFLLMHYLDFVFPLQYTFYQPHSSEGGRGWYLSLLTRTKPLYNAALSLAAYHYSKISLSKSSIVVYDRFEEFHSLALKGLREHVGDLSNKGLREGLKDSIEVLACLVQLVMFEVSRNIPSSYCNCMTPEPSSPGIGNRQAWGLFS